MNSAIVNYAALFVTFFFLTQSKMHTTNRRRRFLKMNLSMVKGAWKRHTVVLNFYSIIFFSSTRPHKCMHRIN